MWLNFLQICRHCVNLLSSFFFFSLSRHLFTYKCGFGLGHSTRLRRKKKMKSWQCNAKSSNSYSPDTRSGIKASAMEACSCCLIHEIMIIIIIIIIISEPAVNTRTMATFFVQIIYMIMIYECTGTSNPHPPPKKTQKKEKKNISLVSLFS